MVIQLLFFAHLRDLAKTNAISVDADAGMLVNDVLTLIKGDVPDELLATLSDKTAMVSINHQYAHWNSALSDGDEVGFLPPVSGG